MSIGNNVLGIILNCYFIPSALVLFGYFQGDAHSTVTRASVATGRDQCNWDLLRDQNMARKLSSCRIPCIWRCPAVTTTISRRTRIRTRHLSRTLNSQDTDSSSNGYGIRTSDEVGYNNSNNIAHRWTTLERHAMLNRTLRETLRPMNFWRHHQRPQRKRTQMASIEWNKHVYLCNCLVKNFHCWANSTGRRTGAGLVLVIM